MLKGVKVMRFEITPEQLSNTNIEKEYVVGSGDYELKVRSSSLEMGQKKVILGVRKKKIKKLEVKSAV